MQWPSISQQGDQINMVSLADTLEGISSRLAEMKSPHVKYTSGDPEYNELAKSLPGPLLLPRPMIQELRDHGVRLMKKRLEEDPGPCEYHIHGCEGKYVYVMRAL
jgi:hypothetical protein